MNNLYLFEKEPLSKHNTNLASTILSRFGAIILLGLAALSLTGCGGGGSGSGSSMQIRPPSGNGPDLIIQSISVNDNTLTPGQRFTVSITVRNQGNRRSAATTLQRDGGSTVSVPSLAPSEISPVTRYSLTAGSSGNISACVTPVSGESNTRNNCGEVSVTVSSGSGNGGSNGGGPSGGSGTTTATWPCPFGDFEMTVPNTFAVTDVEITFDGNTCDGFQFYIGNTSPGFTGGINQLGPHTGDRPSISFFNYNESGRTVRTQHTVDFCRLSDAFSPIFCSGTNSHFTSTLTVLWLSR